MHGNGEMGIPPPYAYAMIMPTAYHPAMLACALYHTPQHVVVIPSYGIILNDYSLLSPLESKKFT
jgi:hypothetical protein